ncbi:MAG TPA: glycosyl hydrolase family 28-related protein [Verrucomicrobiae bacterium]|nr:glycosyl hydrolase family 28-related protein [Verrucomicrobiae bacterium]
MARALKFFLTAQCLLLCAGLQAQDSPGSDSAALRIGNAGVFDIRSFGALGDGQTDCTQAIQKAIDAASEKGGVVLVPVGRWLCAGHLELKMGVHLLGMNQAPQSWEPASGSILLPTEGRDQEEGAPFLQMRSSTSIRGVTIYYPEQKVDNIRPYPWTIAIRGNPSNAKEVSFDSTVENVTLVNSYNGIRTGPSENGRHRLLQINGCVLRRGILVEGTGDIGRVQNVQFHSHFWAHPVFGGNWEKVFDYMQKHLEAFVFGRTDWEYVNDTFVFPARIGYRFIESKNGQWDGACNGQFSGIGADACDTCVDIESLQPQGLLISNGQFDAHRVGRSTQVIVEPGCSGNIRFVNCGFWGPVLNNVQLRGNAYVSFSDCYFANDNQEDPGYSIVAENGRLQVHNSTFDARSRQRRLGHAWGEQDVRKQPGSILLRPGVRSAIIEGNNGYYGVQIKNEIGKRAILRDNEPFLPDGHPGASKDQ